MALRKSPYSGPGLPSRNPCALVTPSDRSVSSAGSVEAPRDDEWKVAATPGIVLGHELEGAHWSPDGPEVALDAGVTAIIQPGGSKRDAEVAAAVERAGAVMVFTGRRHFRH